MAYSKNIKVLVAEDDYLVSEMIVRTLSSLGIRNLVEASTGKEAVEVTLAGRPDVVLMDIEMPEMDGIEATQKIQELCPTPVVILSAHESADLARRASEAGAAAYMTKPPDAATLDRSIAIALARHGDILALRVSVAELRKKTLELERALSEIRTLRGIIPMCMFCKKIRDDEGFWHRVEEYIAENSEATVSHGLCAECLKRHYPGISPDS